VRARIAASASPRVRRKREVPARATIVQTHRACRTDIAGRFRRNRYIKHLDISSGLKARGPLRRQAPIPPEGRDRAKATAFSPDLSIPLALSRQLGWLGSSSAESEFHRVSRASETKFCPRTSTYISCDARNTRCNEKERARVRANLKPYSISIELCDRD